MKGVLDWSKVTSLPGFFKVPIYNTFAFVFDELKKDSIVERANSMAFSFFLSMFPTIIFIFTLIPFLLPYIFNETVLDILPDGNYDFHATLKDQIRELMPASYADSIIGYISNFIKPKAGLLSVGFLLALFFSSNGMLTMMRGFEKSHSSTFVKRSAVKKRFIALQLTFLLGIVLIASVILIVMGNQIVGWIWDYFDFDQARTFGINLFRWVVVLTLFYTVISLVYRVGANTKQRFSFFSPGATLATVLSVLSSVAFSLYIDEFGTYDKLYGSIGIIIFIMLWIQINSFILLIGYELNSSIAVNRDLSRA